MQKRKGDILAYNVNCYECLMKTTKRTKKQAEEIQKIHRNVTGHIACFVNKR